MNEPAYQPPPEAQVKRFHDQLSAIARGAWCEICDRKPETVTFWEDYLERTVRFRVSCHSETREGFLTDIELVIADAIKLRIKREPALVAPKGSWIEEQFKKQFPNERLIESEKAKTK
jgi:hypothetical protein